MKKMPVIKLSYFLIPTSNENNWNYLFINETPDGMERERDKNTVFVVV